jgi:hypothetical protein
MLAALHVSLPARNLMDGEHLLVHWNARHRAMSAIVGDLSTYLTDTPKGKERSSSGLDSKENDLRADLNLLQLQVSPLDRSPAVCRSRARRVHRLSKLPSACPGAWLAMAVSSYSSIL